MDEGLAIVLRWVPKMATRFLETTDPRFEDAVQEAQIAAWKAWESADESKSPRDFFSRRSAQYRLTSMASTRPSAMLGSETSGRSTLDRGKPLEAESEVWERPSDEGPLEDRSVAMIALRQLISGLSDPRHRQVAYGKAVGDTAREIASDTGMSVHWVNSSWSAKIRPELTRLGARDTLSR